MAVKEKTVKLDHHHFGAEPDDPSFDINRARKAHADVMRRWDDPQEGDDFKGQLLMAINAATATDIEEHRSEIQAFLNDFAAGQREKVGKAIVRAYVASTVNAAQTFGSVSKDRTWHEQDWKRNHGQFSSYVGSVGQGERPATRGGYDYTEQQSRDTAGYGQYATLLSQAARIAAATGPVSTKGQDVEFRIADRKGKIRTARGAKPGQLPKLNRGERVVDLKGTGIAAGPGEHLTMGQGTFNLVQALGVPSAAAARAGQVAGVGDDFAQAWDNHAKNEYGSDKGKAFKRIKSGSEALNTIAAGNPKAQAAAAVGRYVGDHGDEAEKVLGPKARKSAYKYRGVERSPRNLPTQSEGMSDADYRNRLVGRISRHIPTRSVHELNLASGYTAPSHGYLLSPAGKVTGEAHGYGDDHYLPFKLSGLHRLRNGSYIRTRSTGGPTTEDVYAAAVSGAKSFTVASRQGTYTMGFDPEFTHDKRFGDIALGMSKRYGKILDAVASGKVKAHGEVKEAQFDQWYQDALKARTDANDPNAEHNAVEEAKAKRVAQEGKEGRTITLDGEGYDYALQSLASQYPYYLSYRARGPRDGADQDKGDRTGYFRSSDARFADSEDLPPGAKEGTVPTHYERIGNRNERDTGYVKPRHIKSADVLTGYFDPSIAGETRRPQSQGGGGTGTGNIRGDLANYQNWSHNPYNPRAARAPQASPPPQQQQQPRFGQVPQGTPAGQQSGVGRANTVSGMDASAHYNLNRVRRLRERGDNHGALAAWAGDHEEYLRAHHGQTSKFRPGGERWDTAAIDDFLSEREDRAKINSGGLTNQRGDESPDQGNKIMEDARTQADYNDLHSKLNGVGATNVRNMIVDHAVRLKDQGHEGLADWEPSDDWAHYNAMAAGGDAIKDSIGQDAWKVDDLITAEDNLGHLEDRMGMAEEHRFAPTVDTEPEDTTHVEQQEGEAPSAQALKAHRDAMASVLTDIGERTGGQVAEEVNDVADQWANVEHATGYGLEEANNATRTLLQRYPRLADMRVAAPVNGGGHQEHKLKDMIITKRDWTVRKSGTKWIVRRVAA